MYETKYSLSNRIGYKFNQQHPFVAIIATHHSLTTGCGLVSWSLMASISLYFASGGSSISLVGTRFFGLNLEHPRQSIRGRNTPSIPIRDIGTFSWTSAVKALAILFVNHALAKFEHPSSGYLKGEAGSLATSLDFCIAKQPMWLVEMFGVDASGSANIRRILRRLNPERKRPGPVEVHVDSSILSPKDVTVYLDDQRVDQETQLRLIDYSLRSNLNADTVSELKRETTLKSNDAQQIPIFQQMEDSEKALQKAVAQREVVFLLTIAMTHPYYAELLDHCNKQFEQILGSSVRMITRAVFVGEDFKSEAAISALMRETETFSDKTLALVVVPIYSNSFTEVLASVADRFRIPLIALTVPFHDERAFVMRRLPIPPLVISDNRYGSNALGKRMGEYLKSRIDANHVSLLLLPGAADRRDSVDRLDGFLEGIQQVIASTECTILESCDWNRELAFTTTLKYFHEKPNHKIDVIFAANDEMALGVRDALVSIGNSGTYAHRLPRVCGYDAIEETRRLIMLNDPLFIGSVDQALSPMARKVAELVLQIRDSSSDLGGSKDVYLIPPSIVFSLGTLASE
jgi:ABC-type sugar transport system substrate-binding protein